jgi:Cu(I)/Ag(I) efflux system membrane fusion protein
VVVVAAGAGQFAVAQVKTGGEREGKTEVLSGLAAGQKVVISGQFLIDSEASLTATINRLEAIPSATESAARDGAPAAGNADMRMHHGAPAKDASPVLHHASGRIDAIDHAAGKLKITHGPVASMGMPGMTMNFPVEDPDLLTGVKPGDKVDFEFRVDGYKWIVTRITPQK